MPRRIRLPPGTFVEGTHLDLGGNVLIIPDEPPPAEDPRNFFLGFRGDSLRNLAEGSEAQRTPSTSPPPPTLWECLEDED